MIKFAVGLAVALFSCNVVGVQLESSTATEIQISSGIESEAGTETGTTTETQAQVKGYVRPPGDFPVGQGMDHQLWSWGSMLDNAQNEVDEAQNDIEDAEKNLNNHNDTQSIVDEISTPQVVLEYHNCRLKRNEEINLYYQCTQNAINNYMLDHFGGEIRSYPRFVEEFNWCVEQMNKAKNCTVTQYFSNNTEGEVQCTPINLSPPVYMVVPQTDERLLFKPNQMCDSQEYPNFDGLWYFLTDEQFSADGFYPERVKDIYEGEEIVDGSQVSCIDHLEEDRQTATMVSTKSESKPPQRWTLELKNVDGKCVPHGTLDDKQFTIEPVSDEISIYEQQYITMIFPTTSKKFHRMKLGMCNQSGDQTHTTETIFYNGVVVS